MRPVAAFIIAMALSHVLTACSGKREREGMAAPSGSTVSITDVSPSVASPLTVGQEINVQVSVAYALTSESGTLGLVVQDGKNTPLGQVVNVVLKGSGTEKLAVSFKVPDTNAIHVFTALSGQGQAATSTVATRSFRVQSK
jgi:uncharacterized membrane protein